MMKRIYKYTFIITFVISSFLLINNVQADYAATVLNPSTSNCSLYGGSTGFCYYKNSSLNSYVGSVIWLDTGDEVTVLTDYDTIDSPNKNVCSDYYVYTSFYFSKKANTYTGYYCHANLNTGSLLTEELKNEFKNAGFPESYWEKLALLKKAHPKWTFRAINTGLDFATAVSNENDGARSLIQGASSNNYAYLALDYGAFNYKTDTFTPYDSKAAPNWWDRWYRANYDTIAYYMDPRNFLIDMYIFQFEALSYDNSMSDENLTNIINSALSGDYLANYTSNFIEAGKISKVNPIYLAALSKQEVANGSTPGTAISGNHNGMYNFYNIGATGGDRPVYNGLDFAANTDPASMRPWSDEYKAIVGGALWMSTNYISVGQDTSYFKKWDVVYNYLVSKKVTPDHPNYTHQYMTNIGAVSEEARTTYRSYYNNNLLDINLGFLIPVYNNMPKSTSLPTKIGWPNNYLKSITLNNNSVADFNGDVENYNYYLDINVPSVTINAIPVSNTASITGTGTFNITEDTKKVITVTAQNGDIKKYNINIILTGTKIEPSIDLKSTMNNSGIKNNDKYLSGLTVGSDISAIKTKILNSNSSTTVILKNSSGAEKNSGVVATGDKVTVSLGDETKDYEVVIYGDVNGDGKIDALDFIKVKKQMLNQITLSGSYQNSADVNKDGKIDALDFIKVKKYMLNNYSSIIQ